MPTQSPLLLGPPHALIPLTHSLPAPTAALWVPAKPCPNQSPLWDNATKCIRYQ